MAIGKHSNYFGGFAARGEKQTTLVTESFPALGRSASSFSHHAWFIIVAGARAHAPLCLRSLYPAGAQIRWSAS